METDFKKAFQPIAGNGDNKDAPMYMDERGFPSIYERHDYETRTFTSFDNVKF